MTPGKLARLSLMAAIALLIVACGGGDSDGTKAVLLQLRSRSKRLSSPSIPAV